MLLNFSLTLIRNMLPQFIYCNTSILTTRQTLRTIPTPLYKKEKLDSAIKWWYFAVIVKKWHAINHITHILQRVGKMVPLVFFCFFFCQLQKQLQIRSTGGVDWWGSKLQPLMAKVIECLKYSSNENMFSFTLLRKIRERKFKE